MVKKNNKRKTLKRKKSLKRKKIGGASSYSSEEELNEYTRPISQTGNPPIRDIGTAIRSPNLPTFTNERNRNVIQPVARHDSNEERERILREELLELITQRINLILEINRIKAEIKRIQESNKRQRTI